MLTPAISASRTSDPPIIIVKAFSTHVTVPPFLYLLPFADEMTIGFGPFCVMTAGPRPVEVRGAVSARPAAAPVRTKSRRDVFLLIDILPKRVWCEVRGAQYRG